MSEGERKETETGTVKFLKLGYCIVSGGTMPLDYTNHLIQTYDTYTLLRPHLRGSSQEVLDERLEGLVDNMRQLKGAFDTSREYLGIKTFDELSESLERRITDYRSLVAERGFSS